MFFYSLTGCDTCNAVYGTGKKVSKQSDVQNVKILQQLCKQPACTIKSYCMVKLNEIKCEEVMKKVSSKCYHRADNSLRAVVISYMYLSWRLVDCLATAEFGYESYEEAHDRMALGPLMMSLSATPHRLLKDLLRNFPLWVCSSFCNEQLCTNATGRKNFWIFPLFCLIKMLPNRMLNLINGRCKIKWVCYAMTYKLWLVLLEPVIQMTYIITEYVTLNCWRLAFIKYNIHVCNVCVCVFVDDGLDELWNGRGLMLWLFVGPHGVYLLDFFCSGIQFNLLLSPYPCFISLLYLDLYV